MSTNPNTKTYWRRVSRLARELTMRLSHTTEAAGDVIARVDPKATPRMHYEAVKLAIEDCDKLESMYQRYIEWNRIGRAALQDFQKRMSFRVIDGGKR